MLTEKQVFLLIFCILAWQFIIELSHMQNEISMMTATDLFYEIGFFSHPNEVTLKDA